MHFYVLQLRQVAAVLCLCLWTERQLGEKRARAEAPQHQTVVSLQTTVRTGKINYFHSWRWHRHAPRCFFRVLLSFNWQLSLYRKCCADGTCVVFFLGGEEVAAFSVWIGKLREKRFKNWIWCLSMLTLFFVWPRGLQIGRRQSWTLS